MTAREYMLRQVSPGSEREIELRGRLFLVGSSPDCDLVLAGSSVPAVLLKIEPVEGGYQCSAATRRPFFINERKVKKARLSPGDRISTESASFIFDVPTGMTTRPETRELQIMKKLTRFIDAVGKQRQLRPLLRSMMRILLELTDGTDIFLFKLDHEEKPQIFECNRREKPEERFSDTVIQLVVERKRGIVVSNALNDPAFKNAHSISDLKLHSFVCAPILAAGRCIGLIYIGSHDAAVSFSENDLEAVQLYASIAGMLFQHIDFITEQQNTIERFTGSTSAGGLIAESPVMRKLLETVNAVASTDITVLLEGETGTGKNRIAEYLHSCSSRSAAPFVVVNCSALHGELLESELFGHRKGSFTGATRDHEGLFASADGGTLMLDEIGELELPLQAKLLRTLESGRVRPIGATQERPVDVRVVCATNRDLNRMVHMKQFRSDLYYRINQFSITVPPMRERGQDVVFLAYLFLNRYRSRYPEKEILDFHPDTLQYIRTAEWPGNIRELANAVNRAVLVARDPFVRFDTPDMTVSSDVNFEEATRRFQKAFIQKALEAADGNRERAARHLGLSRSTFYRYLSQLDI